ncbi:MAG: energy transducer TonB, partial [Bacteroidales bacterium]|nr:energy transducer TonB [Bacteroidales bacterium]
GVDKRNYMMLILQQCTAVDFSRMSNNFSLILTKKRIKMITKNEKTKGLWWRLLVTLPVLAVMLVANTNATAKEQNEEQPKSAEVKNLEDIRIKISQSKDSIYEAGNVEVMPQFPGGDEAMMKFIQENTVYPENAKKNGIGGRTFVSFTIEKDGSISDVKVLRGCDKECDAEAVRVVKSMPKWTPGKVKGQFVRVNFTMPFVFKAPQK